MKSNSEQRYTRSPFEPVAQRVIAFANARFYGESYSLNQTQLALLTALDSIVHFKNNLFVQGSPVFDAVSLYYGQRAGHSTLWALMAAALDPEVVIVYPSAEFAKHHTDHGGGPIPNVKHFLTERQVFAEFNSLTDKPKSHLFHEQAALADKDPTGDVLATRPPLMPTYPYSVVIFDYSGIWHYNKSPDWHQKMRNTLRGLEERQVLTILA